ALAEALETSTSSTNYMMKKLASKNLINYEKYKGAVLDLKGKKAAISIIRKHRLWEVFLHEKLGINWDEIHDIAEELEHIKSPILIEQLEAFLGFPKIDPHGDPIPDKDGNMREIISTNLSSCPQGTVGIIAAVNTDHSLLLKQLDKMNISLGAKIKVEEKMEFDESMIVSVDKNEGKFISKEVSENLLIRVLSN
ncbi:MAG: metal-dependent transcriptional regulator, partial [Bacteroidota bacterium]